MSETRITDSTVARIAGNLAAGLLSADWAELDHIHSGAQKIAQVAVSLARAIVAEVERTRVDGLASRLAAEPAARYAVEPEQA